MTSRLPIRTSALFLSPFLFALLLFTSGCDTADEVAPVSADWAAPALAQGDDTVIIPAPGSTRGDFQLYPVDVPPGGEFIIDLIGGPSPYKVLASVLHRGLQNGETEVDVDLSGMGGMFTVEMRLDESVRHSSSLFDASQSRTVGSLKEPPTSFHYEIFELGDEQVVVMAVDYDREAVGGGGVAMVTPSSEEDAVPTNYLDVLPEEPLAVATEIAGVRMRGVGTGEIVIAEQHVE